jgi:hypothetical protein
MQDKRIVKIIGISGLLISLLFPAMAQQDTSRNIQTTVQDDYIPKLKEVTKKDYNPEIDPPKLTPPTLTYGIEDKEHKTRPEIVPARPQSYSTKETEKLIGNYTKIGYGMYNMPLFETYFHNTRSKKMDYGLRYNFLSGEYVKANRIFSDNNVNGHFSYNLTALSKISARAGYERNRINWYGFNPDSATFDADSTKNIYNRFSGGADYRKTGRTKNDFSYAGGANYYFMKDRFRSKENYFIAKGEVSKLVRQHLLTVPLNITYTTFARDSAYKRLFVDLNPRYFLDYGRMSLNVGFNSTLFNDTAGGQLVFYPCADFRVKIIENKLNAHLGLDGGVQQNTYASLIKQNPFLDTVLQLQHSNTKVRAFGGFWGSITNKLAFGIEADFGNYLNMPFYLCDTTLLRKYKVVYDNVDILNVKATVQLQWGAAFKTTLEFGYHNYKPGNQLYYWNMPTIDAKLNAMYNYNDKFTARLTGYYIGQRYGKNGEYRDTAFASLNSDSVSLKPIMDLNLMLEYRYNKMISIFLNGSNLTNQAYQRWLNYPGYKLAVLGGVAFTF